MAGDDDDRVKTPDGRVFSARALAGSPLAAAGAAAKDVVVGLGKAVATVWRVARALDSALWRGCKLAVRTLVGFLSGTGSVFFGAFADLFRWLPSRGGRAYASASAVVIIVSALWIADEIKTAGAETAAFNSLFRPPIDAADPVVARLDGRYIHLSEVESAARAAGALRSGESLTVRTAFERKLVESFVEQRLLARAALEEGLQRDPAVARRLSAARERILGAAFMESRIAAAATPERVRRIYESQADVTHLGEEVKARHIVVATEAEARDLAAALAAGGDFAAFARVRSLDRATAPLGGEIGWFTRDMMTPAFADAAFAAEKGDIAEPFHTEFGWHVLEVLGRRPSAAVSFRSVEADIRRFLTLRAINQSLAALKQEEEVVYYGPEQAERDAGLRE